MLLLFPSVILESRDKICQIPEWFQGGVRNELGGFQLLRVSGCYCSLAESQCPLQSFLLYPFTC